MSDTEKREKVINGLEHAVDVFDGRIFGPMYDMWMDATKDAIVLLKAQEPITGETSDGYHTFNELYHHRAVLFSVIVANYPDRAWKSKKHHDGTMYDGMFIVGIETPDGQATYHYDIDPYWDMFKCRVLDKAPEWDGHTTAQAIERIGKLAGRKAQEPRVLTLEEACGRGYCFYEYRATGYVEPASVVLSGMLLNGTLPLVEVYRLGREGAALVAANGYGHEWRCWDRMPEDGQKETTPWQ